MGTLMSNIYSPQSIFLQSKLIKTNWNELIDSRTDIIDDYFEWPSYWCVYFIVVYMRFYICSTLETQKAREFQSQNSIHLFLFFTVNVTCQNTSLNARRESKFIEILYAMCMPCVCYFPSVFSFRNKKISDLSIV